MKNKLWKAVVTCLLVVALLSVSVWAVTDTVKNLEAHYTGISLVVNGVQVTPKDANGKVVDPFIVDGTTYLPVRAVASALGEDVSWEGSTRTVYIGEIPGQETNWMKKLPPYSLSSDGGFICDGTDHTKYFTVSGVKQTEGIYVDMGYNYSWGINHETVNVIWNTNSLYKTMKCTIGYSETRGGERNININVYLDGEFYDAFPLVWSDPPKTFSIDLDYCSNVRFEFQGSSYSVAYGMYDISFE